jgi:hypothetical protein
LLDADIKNNMVFRWPSAKCVPNCWNECISRWFVFDRWPHKFVTRLLTSCMLLFYHNVRHQTLRIIMKLSSWSVQIRTSALEVLPSTCSSDLSFVLSCHAVNNFFSPCTALNVPSAEKLFHSAGCSSKKLFENGQLWSVFYFYIWQFSGLFSCNISCHSMTFPLISVWLKCGLLIFSLSAGSSFIHLTYFTVEVLCDGRFYHCCETCLWHSNNNCLRSISNALSEGYSTCLQRVVSREVYLDDNDSVHFCLDVQEHNQKSLCACKENICW